MINSPSAEIASDELVGDCEAVARTRESNAGLETGAGDICGDAEPAAGNCDVDAVAEVDDDRDEDSAVLEGEEEEVGDEEPSDGDCATRMRHLRVAVVSVVTTPLLDCEEGGFATADRTLAARIACSVSRPRIAP
jgi:hypothetical protein